MKEDWRILAYLPIEALMACIGDITNELPFKYSWSRTPASVPERSRDATLVNV